MGQMLDAKIKEKELVDKSAIAGLINNADLNKKVATLATKAELKEGQDKIVKLQAFNSSYFFSKSHLKMMEHRIIQCFSQSTDTFKRLAIQSIFSVEI